jgi:DNA-binding FrmR family transcriptional regulator
MAGITDQICFSPETKKEILARLKRAEGQIRGIQKMIEEERSCQDLVIQLVAAKEAISQVAVAALSNQLVHCLTMEIAEGKPVDSISEKFIEIFKKLV